RFSRDWSSDVCSSDLEVNFRTALRYKPDYAEALLKLGNLLALVGKTDEAVANQLASVRARPEYDEAHYYLAGTLARQKKFDQSRSEERRVGKEWRWRW